MKTSAGNNRMLCRQASDENDSDVASFENPLDLANASLPLIPDTTGFFMLTLFQFFDTERCDAVGHGEALSMLVVGTCLHILNMFVQFALTFALLFFSVERQADRFQRHDLLASVPELDAAVASGVALATTDFNTEVMNLCHSEHHVPYFQSLIILLWVIKLMPPFLQSIRFTIISLNMPDEPEHVPMVIMDEGKFNIICMTRCMKVCVFLCANLPRILMQIFIGWMGAQYLMYASSLNVLVSKAVALVFIRDTGELVFQGLASQEHQDQMKKISLAFQKNEANALRKCWDHWGAPLIKFGGGLIGVLIFCRIYHGDMQNFRDACFHYHYAFDLPECETHHCGTTFFGIMLSN